MKSYRIVLEYTDATDGENGHPETWDWWTLVNLGTKEAMSVVSVEDIPIPAEHIVEIVMEDGDEEELRWDNPADDDIKFDDE